MTRDLHSEIHRELPGEGSGRDVHTRRAFLMLPRMQAPRLLDIGCGSAGPTVELARLSRGEVVGVDIDQSHLDRLAAKAEEAGLADRIRTVNGSMFDIPLPDGSFDIIWAEGSIHIIGFERGLREWQRLLRPGGFLVVHEMVWLQPAPPQEILDHWLRRYPGIRTVPDYVEAIARSGYRLIDHFALPEAAWWSAYYGPLEERVQALRKKYVQDTDALALLDREQMEIDLYKKYQRWYGSAFFVMQETGAEGSVGG